MSGSKDAPRNKALEPYLMEIAYLYRSQSKDALLKQSLGAVLAEKTAHAHAQPHPPDRENVLHVVAKYGRTALLRTLLPALTPPTPLSQLITAVDRYGITPLHYALCRTKTDKNLFYTLLLLLSSDDLSMIANIRIEGHTMIGLASKHADLESMMTLLLLLDQETITQQLETDPHLTQKDRETINKLLHTIHEFENTPNPRRPQRHTLKCRRKRKPHMYRQQKKRGSIAYRAQSLPLLRRSKPEEALPDRIRPKSEPSISEQRCDSPGVPIECVQATEPPPPTPQKQPFHCIRPDQKLPSLKTTNSHHAIAWQKGLASYRQHSRFHPPPPPIAHHAASKTPSSPTLSTTGFFRRSIKSPTTIAQVEQRQSTQNHSFESLPRLG